MRDTATITITQPSLKKKTAILLSITDVYCAKKQASAYPSDMRVSHL